MAALRHVALVVEDLERTFEFYHRIFGLQQVRHRPGRAIHVSDGCFNVALLGKRDRTSEEIRNDIEIDSAGDVGFSHFGLQVKSLESALYRLSQLGLKVSARKRPQDGRFVEERINDPEGNRVDFSENGFGTAGSKGAAGICSLTIRAENPLLLADFYHRALGLESTAGAEGTFVLSDGESSLKLAPSGKGRPPGLAAMGMRVSSIEAVTTELAGYHPRSTIVPDPSRNRHVPSISDPDGNIIELVESS